MNKLSETELNNLNKYFNDYVLITNCRLKLFNEIHTFVFNGLIITLKIENNIATISNIEKNNTCLKINDLPSFKMMVINLYPICTLNKIILKDELVNIAKGILENIKTKEELDNGRIKN